MPRPLITIAEASGRILAVARVLPTREVAVGEALDRVLRRQVRAEADVPPFPCSAMDGYAVLDGPGDRVLRVIGESRAGAPTSRPLAQGEAGTRLDPAALGAAVAAGAGTVMVAERPRVQVLCTGDELREPGEPLGPGEIHNSNAPMLIALAHRSGAVAPEARRLPDDRRTTEAALAVAIDEADVVIVSGGVSVGPHDHVKPALASLGVEEIFWGVALQPGKPTWFGVRDGKLVFGLPGNPVSAFVTFSLFARPALFALQGATAEHRDVEHATLGVAVRRNRDREQALRVRLERTNGTLVAVPNGPQGSHIISSLLGADALALIPSGENPLEAGELVALAPLRH